MTRWIDAARLAVGTLTTVPVPAPRVIDRPVAGRAMLLAPLAAVPLAAVAGAIVWAGSAVGLPSLATAALAIGAVALGSRGLHLDGLADTADGLGASYDRGKALDVMRRGDSGPTGVATLVLVLLVQVGALTAATPATAAAGVLVGRCVLSTACARGVPSARADGLGATVAGSVPRAAALAVGLAAAGLAALLPGLPWWRGPLAVVLSYAVAAALLWRCTKRLGGVTGDVLGAAVEAAVAAALVALST
ncbi:adenosylcobinamide-GDP ribazoletransferase [Amycolatopsis tolypomycina]|uniref:Adenosylcobinamide-GDP ribazoletransferase n=1 Tax=Amycolatopsis tolypomycina TaxID=208445 RepID=A0A1H5AFQ4_9PSEU|nr:adenosylcobinamide-GDP ribazoletransferase [Amycolatopsis tolypomycina]SED40611.1 cobalamin-5'-phosphate synthase [Amycolatopsis tolypomycina]